MKIQITKPAAIDLQEINHYIHQDHPAAAAHMVLRILEAIEYLVKFPTMGRSGRVPKTRELVISGTPFIVVYRAHQQTIFVLRVLHAARKWP